MTSQIIWDLWDVLDLEASSFKPSQKPSRFKNAILYMAVLKHDEEKWLNLGKGLI